MAIAILTVCTGNICRSPLAEQLLRHGLNSLDDVSVVSSGTMAAVGQPMEKQSQALAVRYGAPDAFAHVAKQLTAAQIIAADLVLALSREHRRAVVELVPAAVRKTFTLREFARLAAAISEKDLVDGAIPGQRSIVSAVTVAATFRGIIAPPSSVRDDDVIDPYRRSATVYQASADELVPAVRTSVELIMRAASVGLS